VAHPGKILRSDVESHTAMTAAYVYLLRCRDGSLY